MNKCEWHYQFTFYLDHFGLCAWWLQVYMAHNGTKQSGPIVLTAFFCLFFRYEQCFWPCFRYYYYFILSIIVGRRSSWLPSASLWFFFCVLSRTIVGTICTIQKNPYINRLGSSWLFFYFDFSNNSMFYCAERFFVFVFTSQKIHLDLLHPGSAMHICFKKEKKMQKILRFVKKRQTSFANGPSSAVLFYSMMMGMVVINADQTKSKYWFSQCVCVCALKDLLFFGFPLVLK